MNGVVLVTCAIVILAVAYRFYGKWLAKTWGIDPNALTPALSRAQSSPLPTAGCRLSYGS